MMMITMMMIVMMDNDGDDNDDLKFEFYGNVREGANFFYIIQYDHYRHHNIITNINMSSSFEDRQFKVVIMIVD